MNVLFVMRHPGIGSLAPALRLLGERGHRVQLAFEKVKHEESALAVRSILAECPGVTTVELPRAGKGPWSRLSRRLRLAGNYLRYLEPPYEGAPKLRARAEQKAPPLVRTLARVAGRGGRPGRALLRRSVGYLERCLPPAPAIDDFLRAQDPDLMLVAHVVLLDGGEAEYLRAAKRLGIRTAFPVRGWDNLTNKGLIRDVPDRVLVWNEPQAKEAEEMHGIPPDRIRITGAPKCDPLFSWAPRRSREEFCAEVGLRPDRAVVLYVCSSRFVAPDEVPFVRSWIAALRAHGGTLADAGLLVRPHPLNAAQWKDTAALGPQVAVWPPQGETPQDEPTRENYYNAIYHAGAVVGINTTAQIESAILGRPVHTVLAPEFEETQEGTLHFRHLETDEFGHLVIARTLEEHAAQLESSLKGEWERSRSDRFVRLFVRPRGLDRSATETLVEELEELAASPAPAPARMPVFAPLVRLALATTASRARAEGRRQKRERESVEAPVVVKRIS